MDKTVMEEILEIEDSILPLFSQALGNINVEDVDGCILDYYDDVVKADGQLSNEQLRKHLSMMSYYGYVLSAVLAKQSLRRDVARMYFENVSAKHQLNVPQDGQKYTREDKSALAKLGTKDEATVSILYNSVVEAIERRIKAINTTINTLNTISAMNMSEAKLQRL